MRVLLTGIHLMRTGEVEANLSRLDEVFRLPQLPDLIEAKRGGAEKGFRIDYKRLIHGEPGQENIYLEPGDTLIFH